MAGKEKKMAAAMAAVSLYLEQEIAAADHEKIADRAGGFGQSPWGLSGRQEIMAMRRLTQLRVFTRI